MRLSVNRLFAALPDAITACVYLGAWIDPAIVGAPAIKNLMLTMLIEFVVIHSSAFYSFLATADLGRGKRVLMLSGLTAFYMIFVLGFAAAFHSTWPIFAFGWLFLCRFFHLWMRPGEAASQSQMIVWAASFVTYIIGGIATVALPLPALGMTPDFIASMHFEKMSGEWVTRPYTVLAFGTVYFAVQAFAKYKATPQAAPALAARA